MSNETIESIGEKINIIDSKLDIIDAKLEVLIGQLPKEKFIELQNTIRHIREIAWELRMGEDL